MKLALFLGRSGILHSNMIDFMIEEIILLRKQFYEVVELDDAEEVLRPFKSGNEYLNKVFVDTLESKTKFALGDYYNIKYTIIKCEYWEKVSIFKKVTKGPKLFRIYDSVIFKDFLHKS